MNVSHEPVYDVFGRMYEVDVYGRLHSHFISHPEETHKTPPSHSHRKLARIVMSISPMVPRLVVFCVAAHAAAFHRVLLETPKRARLASGKRGFLKRYEGRPQNTSKVINFCGCGSEMARVSERE